MQRHDAKDCRAPLQADELQHIEIIECLPEYNHINYSFSVQNWMLHTWCYIPFMFFITSSVNFYHYLFCIYILKYVKKIFTLHYNNILLTYFWYRNDIFKVFWHRIIPVRYYMVIFIITNNITYNISDTCVILHLHSSYMCVLLDYMYIKYIKSSIYLQVEIPAPAIVMILQFVFSLIYSTIPSKLSLERTNCCGSLFWSFAGKSTSLNFWAKYLRNFSISE